MSLQDEYLQQALKEAPDRDLAPSEAVRKNIFAHVDASVKSKESWFLRWFGGLGRLQLVGLSTVASAVIVLLVIYPQAPDKQIWTSEEESADIAFSEQPEAQQAESESIAAPPATANNHEPAPSAAALSEEVHRPAPASVRSMAKKSGNKQKTLGEKKEKETASVEAELDQLADDKTVLAEQESLAMDQPATTSMATSSAPQASSFKRLEKSESVQSSALGRRALSGVELALQDIAAGRLRILLAGDVWPEQQPMVDEETGYKVELSQLSAEAVAKYNATVRKWYREHKQTH